MTRYNKLVRDKIPAVIERSGEKAVIHVANQEEYEAKLLDKLREEVEELIANPSEEELADIMEVLDAIAGLYKMDMRKAAQIKNIKAAKRGRFAKRIILEKTL